MTKLSQAQTQLLTAAARAEGGFVDTPDGSRATVASLIKRQLVISVPQVEGPSRVLITSEGRAAIGAEPEVLAKSTTKQGRVPSAQKAASGTGKISILLDLLRRPEGVTIEAMMAATGWQAHSVRGAISGSIKKAKGLNVTSEKTEAGRIYRVTEAASV